jgi:hypothetical protein
MLDTLHKATPHVTIPFGPRTQSASTVRDSIRVKKTDSALMGKTDSSRKPPRTYIKKINDSAALIPKEKPVIRKDSNSNQAP